jgi:bile acid:Na+ symporter, BASS family
LTKVFNVSVTVSVITTVLALGLSLRSGEVLAPFRRARILVPVVAANLVLLPGLAWAITRMFGQTDAAITGIALVAVGAGGSLALRTAQLSGRADMAFTLSLVVLLQVLNLVAMPLWFGAFADTTAVGGWRIVQDLLLVILLPLALGMVIRALVPGSVSLRRALVPIANVTLAIAVTSAIVGNRDVILQGGHWTIVATAAIVACTAVSLGWLAGGKEPAIRTATAIVTGKRFTSLGLVVIGTQLGADPAVLGPAVTYALVDFAIAVAFALVLARLRVVGADPRIAA